MFQLTNTTIYYKTIAHKHGWHNPHEPRTPEAHGCKHLYWGLSVLAFITIKRECANLDASSFINHRRRQSGFSHLRDSSVGHRVISVFRYTPDTSLSAHNWCYANWIPPEAEPPERQCAWDRTCDGSSRNKNAYAPRQPNNRNRRHKQRTSTRPSHRQWHESGDEAGTRTRCAIWLTCRRWAGNVPSRATTRPHRHASSREEWAVGMLLVWFPDGLTFVCNNLHVPFSCKNTHNSRIFKILVATLSCRKIIEWFWCYQLVFLPVFQPFC